MALQIRRVAYEPIEIDPRELMTVSEAARLLDMTMPGVIAAIQRDVFTEIVEDEPANPQRDRRFLLRAEVLARARSR